MKTRKQWQEEFRKVGELAVSTDDCSDTECVARYAANCIVNEIEKAWEEGYDDGIKDSRSVIGDLEKDFDDEIWLVKAMEKQSRAKLLEKDGK